MGRKVEDQLLKAHLGRCAKAPAAGWLKLARCCAKAGPAAAGVGVLPLDGSCSCCCCCCDMRPASAHAAAPPPARARAALRAADLAANLPRPGCGFGTADGGNATADADREDAGTGAGPGASAAGTLTSPLSADTNVAATGGASPGQSRPSSVSKCSSVWTDSGPPQAVGGLLPVASQAVRMADAGHRTSSSCERVQQPTAERRIAADDGSGELDHSVSVQPAQRALCCRLRQGRMARALPGVADASPPCSTTAPLRSMSTAEAPAAADAARQPSPLRAAHPVRLHLGRARDLVLTATRSTQPLAAANQS